MIFRYFSLVFLIFLNFKSSSQSVYDLGVRQIEIFFSEPHWDDSLDLYLSNNLNQRLVADSIIIDGEVDQNVGVMYVNNSSYFPNNIKNPIDIKLDYIQNGQSIDRYNRLTLSNGYRDPSFVREVLAYEIASNYMPSPKSTYSNVYVNGTHLGLYTCVQSIDDDFTNENFYERRGPLFEVKETNLSISGCSGQIGVFQHFLDTNCYQRSYEMNSSNDWQKLSNFLDTFNNHFSEIESVLDIDRTIWMMALQNLIVSLDAPINTRASNFHLFKDNNGRFSPIISGLNMSFGAYVDGLSIPVNNSDLQQLDIFHDISNPLNYLNNKIYSNDRFKKMYVAHMRTILNEFFVNNLYKTKALDLQNLISNDINLDPNSFYSFSEFNSNLDNSVGTTSSVIGISELIDARVSYIQSLSEFTSVPPSIDNITSNPTSVLPHTTVYITAEISNVNYAYLAYRFKFSEKFNKIQMYDDGNNGDGIAGDGIYGASINVDARDIQYYIYSENNDAGIFSPERAEKEFYQTPVVGGLVINEIMAGNSISVADQDGEYDDWVELYNGNNFSLNLNGYYLSDNENDLFKWSFPNVTIQPNDYLIVWCDTAGSSQSGLHTTYRLSADQEEVYLSDPNGNLIDAVHFVNMVPDQGYARVPNGSGVMIYQDHTYNAPNSIVSSHLEHKNISFLKVYPSPSTNIIYLLGDFEEVLVYNLAGQNVFSSNKVNSIDISDWKSGVYFIYSKGLVQKFIKQ